jgi:hypothetical protein
MIKERRAPPQGHGLSVFALAMGNVRGEIGYGEISKKLKIIVKNPVLQKWDSENGD